MWMALAMPRKAGTASEPMICGETKKCTRSTKPAASSAVFRRVPVSVSSGEDALFAELVQRL